MISAHRADAARPVDVLARDLDASIADASPADLARQRQRLLLALPARATRSAWRLAFAAVSLAALAMALGPRLKRSASSPVLRVSAAGRNLTAGQWIAAETVPVTLRFSDGSSVTLATGAHARVEALDAHGATVLLERGHAEASVRHRSGARWRFSAGPYNVRVTGTSFALAWQPTEGRFDLQMHDGRVELRGPRCHEGLAVAAREEVHASLPEGRLVVGPWREATPAPSLVAQSPVPQEPIPAMPVPQEPIPTARAPHRTHAPSPTRAAHAPLVAPPTAPEYDAAARLREADALRLSAQGMRAREVLLDLRARAPRTPEATRAAFVLGVLSLETFQAPAEAARWFQLCVEDAPDGPLANEARGRRVQSLHAAGDRDGARDAAVRYLDRDPDGPFAPFARAMLAR